MSVPPGWSMTADDAAAGRRLDRVLREARPDLSFAAAQKLMREGRVRVDGRRAKPDARLEPGQTVTAPPPRADAAPRKRDVAAPDADLVAQLQAAVLRMDEAILALDKPAGIACQGGSKTRRHIAGAAPGLAFDAGEPPRLVHRLDRDTTGVLLMARNRAAAEALSEAFESRAVEKTYWAIVIGDLGKARKGVIDAPLGKRPGPGGEKMAVDDENGLPAETRWKVLDRGRGCALLALTPLTGRTHQLRVHCAALGWPILGDGKYGGAAAFLDKPGVGDGLRLHARRLALPHPLSGRPTEFAAEPPAAFLAELKALQLNPQARRR